MGFPVKNRCTSMAANSICGPGNCKSKTAKWWVSRNVDGFPARTDIRRGPDSRKQYAPNLNYCAFRARFQMATIKGGVYRGHKSFVARPPAQLALRKGTNAAWCGVSGLVTSFHQFSGEASIDGGGRRSLDHTHSPGGCRRLKTDCYCGPKADVGRDAGVALRSRERVSVFARAR